MGEIRKTIRGFSRKKIIRRLLSLPHEPHPEEPGLILIQVDALSRAEFERALAKKRMPFLSRLLTRRKYTLYSHYSGIPSTTPAVQAELFYGKLCAVPSFDFVDRKRQRYCSMLDSTTAAEIERKLDEEFGGIVSGGSAYSNIYSGGSDESHFCAAHLGWGELLVGTEAWRICVIVLLHIAIVFRILFLAVVEFGLALWDAARGAFGGCGLRHEFSMLMARMFISIVLREWITLSAQVDVIRGLPVIEANFLGYDEQCHRRGPKSLYARWTLKGIDGSIHRIWSSAQGAADRKYKLWIYSDHGQEQTVPYAVHTGRSLRTAIDEVLSNIELELQEVTASDKEDAGRRDRGYWVRPPKKKKPALSADGEEAKFPYLTHKGPVGHLYLPESTSVEDMERLAEALVEQAGIPMVMRPDGEGAIIRVRRGRFRLPDDAAEVLGEDHPFMSEVGEDLVRLAHHEWAGSLVLIGWERDQYPPLSFVTENGAHGGPGPVETHGFALLPHDAPVDPEGRSYLRPRLIHDAVLRGRPARAKPEEAA
jgi:hypothetical protein